MPEGRRRRRFKKDRTGTVWNLEKQRQDNRQDPMQLNKIIQKFYGMLIGSGKKKQFYRQDNIKSCRILQYPRESYRGILSNLSQIWKRSYSIINKIIWNPTGSYTIVDYPKRSYRILWDGIVDKQNRTPQHSVKL